MANNQIMLKYQGMLIALTPGEQRFWNTGEVPEGITGKSTPKEFLVALRNAGPDTVWMKLQLSNDADLNQADDAD